MHEKIFSSKGMYICLWIIQNMEIKISQVDCVDLWHTVDLVGVHN